MSALAKTEPDPSGAPRHEDRNRHAASTPALPIARWLERAAGAVLKFFYPEVCQLCRSQAARAEEGFVCLQCRAKVKLVEPPICSQCGRPVDGAVTGDFTCGNCRGADLSYSKARAAGLFKEELLEVLHRYKYNRALWFEPLLAGLLCDKAAPELANETWNCIVPVPLYPARERDRGFNQAERLARHLARATGIPLNPRILRRVLPTRTQTQLTREERLENVRRAFELRRGACVSGLRIVVVDDVFTTGATTNACARVLCKAGADQVCVWTVARGL